MNGVSTDLRRFGALACAAAALGGCALVGKDAAAPGKADLQYRHDEAADQANFIWWTPVAKGGVGVVEPAAGRSTVYAGAFVRPLAGMLETDDLIVGAGLVSGTAADDVEAQAEYRFGSGLGVGGGFVERGAGPDVRFGKVSYRAALGRGWRTIAAAQVQRFGPHTDPGAYLAVFDERVMLTAGADGEQWRAVAGFVARPREGRLVRPAVEALYVDNSVGSFPGPRVLFVNGTLGFRGGFLAHPARLGRAMGPTGLEFGNPLGFLQPTWNRRLEVWEMGELLDVRLIRQEAGSVTASTWEGVLFPLQATDAAPPLRALFAGASHTDVPGRPSTLLTAGWLGDVAPSVNLMVKLDYETRRGVVRPGIGLIRRFTP